MIIGPGPADLTGGYELANNRYKVQVLAGISADHAG
jgi:ribulose 1,5-bisphosphate synthetase/thiazole synthase